MHIPAIAPNKALQPMPVDRRGLIEVLGRARLTLCRWAHSHALR
jgi:hypothetical protein